MSYIEPHKVKIENEDVFELITWLQEMREKDLQCRIGNVGRGENIRSLERRLAIFERIMKQLP